MWAVEHPPHQLKKERHIGPKKRMPSPHQRQGNKEYAWKTPSRGENRHIHPLRQVPST